MCLSAEFIWGHKRFMLGHSQCFIIHVRLEYRKTAEICRFFKGVLWLFILISQMVYFFTFSSACYTLHLQFAQIRFSYSSETSANAVRFKQRKDLAVDWFENSFKYTSLDWLLLMPNSLEDTNSAESAAGWCCFTKHVLQAARQN